MNKNKNERICRMDFRVSPSEKEKIIGIAKKCKISTSEYLRKRALGYAVKAAPPEAFFYFMRDLKRLIKGAPTPKVEEEALKLFDNIYAQLVDATKQSKQEIVEEMMQWQAQDSGPSNLD